MRKPGLLIPGPRAACSSPGHIWASEQRNQSSWRPSTAAGKEGVGAGSVWTGLPKAQPLSPNPSRCPFCLTQTQARRGGPQ